jgi:tetratricopeptide (TPR) repeat protein
MNERFMFVPSIAFAIVAAYYILKIKNPTYVATITILLLLPYTAKTISRNTVWYDDYTLFTHDVKISYDSAKSTTSAGGVLIDKSKEVIDPVKKKQMLTQAKRYLHKAIEIHPRYVDALLLLGNAYYTDNKQLDSTWLYYKRILQINPIYPNVYNNLRMMFEYEGDTANVDTKIKIAKSIAAMKRSPKKEKAYFLYKAGNFYGRFKNMLDSAITLLNQSLELDSTNTRIYKDLGVAYALAGNLKKSEFFTKKAINVNPNDASLYYNLGVTYYRAAVNAEKNGNKDSAVYYIRLSQKYFAIQKNMTNKK